MAETIRRHHIRRGVPVRPHPMRVPESPAPRLPSEVFATDEYLIMHPTDPLVMARMDEARAQANAERAREDTRQLFRDSERIRANTERLNRIFAVQRQREIPAGAR